MQRVAVEPVPHSVQRQVTPSVPASRPAPPLTPETELIDTGLDEMD